MNLKKSGIDPVAVWGFVLAALILRAGYLFAVGPEFSFPDEERFYAQVQSVAGTLAFPVGLKAHDMPLTVLLLGLLQRITGCGLFGMKLFLCGISSLTVLPIGLIAFRLYPSRTAFNLACLMACVYPFFIYYSRLLLSESVFLFLLSNFFVVLLCPPFEGKGWLAGLLAGLAQLTRPTLVFFLPVAAIWAMWRSGWRLRHVALAGVVFALLLAPWVVRNAVELGTPLLNTSNSGHVLWEGNNPWNPKGETAAPEWGYMDDVPDALKQAEDEGNEKKRALEYQAATGIAPEVALDAWERKQAVDFIMENPDFFLRAAMHKFLRFWNVVPNHPSLRNGVYFWGALFSFGPVLLLALAGVYVLRHNWQDLLLLWGFIGYYTLLHMVTIGSIRYRLPLEPLLLAMAAATCARSAERIMAFRKGI